MNNPSKTSSPKPGSQQVNEYTVKKAEAPRKASPNPVWFLGIGLCRLARHERKFIRLQRLGIIAGQTSLPAN